MTALLQRNEKSSKYKLPELSRQQLRKPSRRKRNEGTFETEMKRVFAMAVVNEYLRSTGRKNFENYLLHRNFILSEISFLSK